MNAETTPTSQPTTASDAHNQTAVPNAHARGSDASQPNVAPQEAKPQRDWKQAVAVARAKKEKREAERKAKELEAQAKEAAELKELLASNPLKAYERAGKSARDLVATLINPPEDPDELDPQEKRLRAIEERMAAEERAKAEAQDREEREYIERNISSYKGDVARLIKEQAERFDLNALEGEAAVEAVWRLVHKNFIEEGELMTPEQALQLREEYLEHQEKQRVGKSKKLAALWGSNGAPKGNEAKDSAGGATTAGGTRGDGRPPVVRTLTNARSGDAAPKPSSWSGHATSREAVIQQVLERHGIK